MTASDPTVWPPKNGPLVRVSPAASGRKRPFVISPSTLNTECEVNGMGCKKRFLLLAFVLFGGPILASDSTAGIPAEGTFQPNGPPQQRPVRVDAGESCIVDVEQAYIVNGTLSGSFDIDYRILVMGPCGSPVGTFDEEWIAHGRFAGTINGVSTSATFTYTATVKAGGEVSGQIVLGQGLGGDLRVHGSFSDGELAYKGRLTEFGRKQK
jgi:hypothetical protein